MKGTKRHAENNTKQQNIYVGTTYPIFYKTENVIEKKTRTGFYLNKNQNKITDFSIFYLLKLTLMSNHIEQVFI